MQIQICIARRDISLKATWCVNHKNESSGPFPEVMLNACLMDESRPEYCMGSWPLSMIQKAWGVEDVL